MGRFIKNHSSQQKIEKTPTPIQPKEEVKKEIENYISTEDLQHRFGTQLPALGQYELFPQYIDTCYKNFSNKKVVFAKEMAEFITAEKSRAVLDLKVQIERLYKTIKQWNRKD